MYSKQTLIKNKTGIHARPAANLASLAKGFASEITIKNLDSSADPINAKSVMRVLGLGLSCGVNIEVSAVGTDETKAVDEIIQLIDSFLDD